MYQDWPIQSDHLIADYDDTAFRAGTLTCTFLESRSMTGKLMMGNKSFILHAVFFSSPSPRGTVNNNAGS